MLKIRDAEGPTEWNTTSVLIDYKVPLDCSIRICPLAFDSLLGCWIWHSAGCAVTVGAMELLSESVLNELESIVCERVGTGQQKNRETDQLLSEVTDGGLEQPWFSSFLPAQSK